MAQLSEFKDTYSWQGAIDLGPQLIRLAEELPGTEEMGLSWQLRQIMVDLPTAIAVDLEDGTNTRRDAAYKLVSVLELIERVYPALDTAGTRNNVADLISYIGSDAFADRPAPEPAPTPAEEAAPAGPAADVAVVPEPTPAPGAAPAVAPPAAAATTPVAPAPAPTPAPTPAASTAPAEAAPAPTPAPTLTIPVQAPHQEDHVQPDSSK